MNAGVEFGSHKHSGFDQPFNFYLFKPQWECKSKVTSFALTNFFAICSSRISFTVRSGDDLTANYGPYLPQVIHVNDARSQSGVCWIAKKARRFQLARESKLSPKSTVLP
jgi:hypothetical protein